MSSSFPVEIKSLPDKLNERRESLSDESTERRATLPDGSIERTKSLPIELIEEILSWLPVKAAVRFSIVCKLFHTIIQDQKFIEKHMHHSKIYTTIVTTQHPNKAPIIELSWINGLILERVSSTRRFRIRNYASNKILQLPELKGSVLSCSLRHLSHTNEYKVVGVYFEGNSGVGMKMFTAGTDIAWRPIQIPISLDYRKNRVTSISALEGITYIVEFSKPDLKQSKMLAFKPEDETFMEIPIPQEVLFSESECWAVHCELTICLICRVEGGFSLWVLDYDKKPMWIEKKLVENEDISILDINIAVPEFVSDGWLRCHCSGGDQPTKLLLHIESRRILRKGTNLRSRVENKKTLVSFRGMH